MLRATTITSSTSDSRTLPQSRFLRVRPPLPAECAWLRALSGLDVAVAS
jgi:hypothetical protein